MNIEVIPLSQLQIQTPEFLTKRCDSGQALVVELPVTRVRPASASQQNRQLRPLVSAITRSSCLVPRSPFGDRPPGAVLVALW